jgi:hypothetical protein
VGLVLGISLSLLWLLLWLLLLLLLLLETHKLKCSIVFRSSSLLLLLLLKPPCSHTSTHMHTTYPYPYPSTPTTMRISLRNRPPIFINTQRVRKVIRIKCGEDLSWFLVFKALFPSLSAVYLVAEFAGCGCLRGGRGVGEGEVDGFRGFGAFGAAC